METQAESPIAAVENLLDKYKGELSRLEGTKKGLEVKIASTRAKIDGLEEAVAAAKSVKPKVSSEIRITPESLTDN